MRPSYEQDRLLPLASDAMIEERVLELIGRANRRQLWLLFLDEDNVQLPLLIPIDGLPPDPTDDGSVSVVDNVGELMGEIGAAGLVVVWERYGPSAMSVQDTAWARSFAAACVSAKVPLRAMLLSHRAGVRWIAADDYF